MISVLLATYNGERYIQKSIESVLNQTYKDFELLIGFNGTTDSSKEILKNFTDSRIRVFDYCDDKGKSKTLNKLIKEAKYDWVAIQDDDDIWLPRKLEKQFAEINKNKDLSVVGTQIFYIDENENIIGKPNLSLFHEDIKIKSLNGDNQIANTSAVFLKKAAFDVDCWNENIVGIEDFDFWLKMLTLGCKFSNLNKELVLHRIHGNSNFNTKKWNVEDLIKKYKTNEYI